MRHYSLWLSPLRFSVFMSVALLLAACTLSMDEWVETEEQKGYDDVETIQNDFYTLKYEYKETTRSLTDDIQQYVVEVEADTIIYFLDNTPSEWLPKKGGFVVSNCCENFPMGLMGRVLSVEKANGLIKVVTTDASLEDCYKEFDLDFEADIFTSKPEEQETDTVVQSRFTRSAADGSKEVVIRDWGMFRAIQNGEKQKRNIPNYTRTELEDIYDRDIDSTTTETNDVLMFQVSLGGDLAEKFKTVCSKLNTIDIKVYHTTKTYMHKIVKLKEKREYTNSKTTNGIKLSSLVGVDLLKAKTDKQKLETSKKVSEWLHDRGKFPKLSQELDAINKDKKDIAFVIEIPLGSLPFGVILRLKPTFDVNFGIYGDVEAIWWTSASHTITDVIDGNKITDKSEKIALPDNQFAFNAFGSFHIGGGGEIFVGVGKRTTKDAVGIGAFLGLTLDFDLNITPVTIGDYTLGSADEFCSITGNGKYGGKILTGGLFGDISFYVHDFKWWKGVTWTYNPRVQFDGKFISAPDEDSKGVFTRQTMAYTYTDLGLNTSNMWTTYRKPVLCVYEKEDQALDKPTEVLYDKSFHKPIKKNTRYEFVYKNYKKGQIYIVPGVEGPSGPKDITLYPAYKTQVHTELKPNIEYELMYDADAKKYDYVYQDFEVEKTENTITYKWALPFTLRNAAAIDDYWDDWGVYTILYDDVGPMTKTETYTSLKSRVYASGKYLHEITYVDYSGKNLSVESCIYYLPKGASSSSARTKLNDYNSREYSYHLYKVWQYDQGDKLLKTKHPLSKDGGEWGYPDGYRKFKKTM